MTRIAPFLIALVFFGAVAVLLSLAASAFAAAQERTVFYKYLAEALDAEPEPTSSVEWDSADRSLARAFTRVDEAQIGVSLTSAWRAHALGLETGHTEVLVDHFSGPALGRATHSASEGYKQEAGMVILSQSAQPVFYHLDGSVLQVEAEALAVRFAISDDALQHFEMTRDSVVTTLMNETTGWRVFAHEMHAFDPVDAVLPTRPFAESLAGINYYPAETPWRRFWSEFDPVVVASDFQVIADLGANAVRVFLPVRDFSDPEMRTENLEKLEHLLRIADRYELRVVPTLFDMKPSFSLANWAGDLIYLETVLPVLAASDAVAFVDLKNEPDLDFEHYGRGLIEAWLRTMVVLAKDISPALPITIGWSDADAALILSDHLDVLSYHDYQPLDGAEERLADLREQAGGKPVHVTEIGASSFSAVVGYPGSPSSQAKELARRLDALREADGIFVWTLHDFPAPDKAAVGSSPWTVRLQSQFGLIDSAGAEKPAYRIVSEAFGEWLDHRNTPTSD